MAFTAHPLLRESRSRSVPQRRHLAQQRMISMRSQIPRMTASGNPGNCSRESSTTIMRKRTPHKGSYQQARNIRLFCSLFLHILDGYGRGCFLRVRLNDVDDYAGN
eukprot:498640-Amphidinium_carterae.1